MEPDPKKAQPALPNTESAADCAPSMVIPMGAEPAEFSDQTIAYQAGLDIEALESSIPFHKEYTIREEIARGGMGRIFSATDPKLEREVAVKVSACGEPGEDVLFANEAKVLAELAHPNIVPIHDLGKDAQGRSFYSMKLIRGKTLLQIIRESKSGDEQALSQYSRDRLLVVFRKVCDAVAFAHAKGYLHRDLKPENVMLGEYGEVLVMDWGLAQKMSDGVATPPGADGSNGAPSFIQGTPQYMSPEQANGEPLEVRSDIYALGGVLFSILSYEKPVTGTTLEEILNKVRTGVILPREWSQTLSLSATVDAQRWKKLPLALQAVTKKAMALDPRHRYQNVTEMMEDIESYQNGFATRAEQAGLFVQLFLLVKRHRMAAALVGVLLVSAAIFTAQLATSERRARHNALLAEQEAQRASLNAQRAEQEAERATLNAQRAEVNEKEAQKQAGIAEANAKRAIEEKESARLFAAKAHMTLAAEAEKQGFGQEMLDALEQVPQDLRTQHWDYIRQKLDTSTLTIQAKGGTAWRGCVPHPLDSEKLLTLQRDGWVRTLTPSSGTFEDLFQIDSTGLRNGIAVSRDGMRLAVYRQLPSKASGEELFQFDVFKLPSGEPQCSIQQTKKSGYTNDSFVLSADGKLLLLSSGKGAGFHMFDASNGALLWEGSEACHAFANFSKDGKSVYVCSDTDGNTQRDPATGKVWSSRPQVKLQGWRNINAGSPASESMFCVTNAYCLRIETEGGKTTARFPLPSGAAFVGSIAYLPERGILAVVATQSPAYGILQFWDVNSGDLLHSIPVPSAGNQARGDGDWSIVPNLISGDFVITRGAEMKIWRLPRSQGEKTLPIESDSVFDDFAFLNELNTVAGAFRVSKDKQEDVGVGVMNIESRETYYPLEHTFTAHKRRRCILTTDRSTKLISTLTQKLNPTRYPLALFRFEKDGATEISLPEVFPLEGHAHLSPKGDAIWAGNCIVETGATSSGTKLTKIDRQGIIEPPLRERTPRWVGDTHVVEIVDLKPPKGSNNIPPTRHLLLWNVENGRRAAVISAPFAKTLSSSPDGTLIAEGGSDKMLRIRDAKTLTEQQVLRVHDGGVSAVAWHPKLPLIATASDDRTVKIWNLNTGVMVEELGFFEAPDRLFWSPEGTQLAVRRILNPLQIFSPKSCQ